MRPELDCVIEIETQSIRDLLAECLPMRAGRRLVALYALVESMHGTESEASICALLLLVPLTSEVLVALEPYAREECAYAPTARQLVEWFA